MQAALGIVALTFGLLSGAVSLVSAVGWLGDLPSVVVGSASGESAGYAVAAVSLLMIAGFGSTSVLLLRAARRMLK